jgi:hypothetical protein
MQSLTCLYLKIKFKKNSMSWSKDKHIEYRKLKRSGYTDKMLIEHFGENIYESGMYNRKSSIMPWLQFITEINITPEYTDYNLSKKSSDIYLEKFDYIIRFEDDNTKYIISLFYYIIDEIETYNILLTTEKQWMDYESKLNDIQYKGYITNDERIELINIVEKETGLNRLYPVMKKVSYILFDVIKKLGDMTVSLGETGNIVKINLYRNIIKNSFVGVIEIDSKFDNTNNKYYIYKISDDILKKETN